MKKTFRFSAILAILLVAASCQNDLNQDNTLKATASIANPSLSRVTYTVNNAASEECVTPVWTVGDKLFGFDSNGALFTFEVESVDGSGRAILNTGAYAPAGDETLYALYAPGYNTGSFAGSGAARTLTVDLSSQSGSLNDASPVLMCATATISAGAVSFDFENQTAIIGVKRFKLPAAATLTSISLEGVVTEGTFSVVGGSLKLTPAATKASVSATGSWATGAGNICSTAIYFASLPQTDAYLVLNASDGVSDYTNLSAIAGTDIEAGYYYFTEKNLGAPVAEVSGVNYGSLPEAVAAANRAAGDVTVTLLDDVAYDGALNFSNSGSHAITLDLNGHILSTTVKGFITTTKTLTITDSQITKGKITSSESKIINVTTAGTVNLDGCVIECTKETGSDFQNDPVLFFDYNKNSTFATINDAKVYSTKKVSVIGCRDVTMTIAGSEIASGTAAAGWYAVVVNDYGDLTVGSSSFYTSGTGYASTLHCGSSNASVTVNGGWFHSGGRAISAVDAATGAKVTVNAAILNMDLTHNVSPVAGKSVEPLSPEETHTLAITGATLNYGYHVVESSQEYPVDGEHSFEDAVAAAKASTKATATVKLYKDVTYNSALDLTNANSGLIVLDLNGHVLSTTASPFISTTHAMTITDSNATKGKITSTGSKIVNVITANTTTNIDGCVIECTKATGENFQTDPVLHFNYSASTTVANITDAKVYSTGKVTVLFVPYATVTVTNSELTSGKDAAGWYVMIANYYGNITVNSGSFYTSGTGYASTLHCASANASITVNGGWFYSTGRRISAASSDAGAKMTLNGGYLSDYVTSGTYADNTTAIFGAGKSIQSISPVSHTHETTGGTLSYTYQVK